MFSEDVLQAALKLIENLSTDPIRAFGYVFETSKKSKPFFYIGFEKQLVYRNKRSKKT